MKLIVAIFFLLMGCTIQQEKAVEDFLEGEAQVVGKVSKDLNGSIP